jgi:hypothetical protein
MKRRGLDRSFASAALRARSNSRWRAERMTDGMAEPVVPDFDDTSNEEIAAISAEIGATGARRPASE